jgi:hypothetical protein
MPSCPGITRKGTACQGIVQAGSDYCAAHDPSRVEARKRAASIAGRSKAGSEISEVKRQLRRLADDVLAGRQNRADASVVSQVLGVWLKAVETEIRERETVVKERELVEIRLPEFQTLEQEVAELRDVVERSSPSVQRRSPWAG